jgi:hypothetical protein
LPQEVKLNVIIMKKLLLIGVISAFCGSAVAQTKSATATATTPETIVSVVESVTGKQFKPDTTYATLSKEDESLLAKEPTANWGFPQNSGQMTYYNLIVGTRSYQLIVLPTSKTGAPLATLLRFTNPKAKPEPIARGTLSAKAAKQQE